MTREQLLVELVDPSGVAVGSSTVDEAHRLPGKLHRAFSVLLVDAEGRFLLQRRAAVKTRFPLCWANACCGHPEPGQRVAAAAAKRLDEELGVVGVELHELGVYAYEATDPETDRIEREYDHVLLGHVDADLAMLPDPAEVAEVRWMTRVDLDRDFSRAAEGYAPWLSGVMSLAPHHR